MTIDARAATLLLIRQSDVLSRAQAFAVGLSPGELRHRIRCGGPWQTLLPGIYLTVTGAPTQDQRKVAASLLAGPGSVITGPAALAMYRVRSPQTDLVDVLVPASRRRASAGFAVIHRTRRMPAKVLASAALDYATPARAVADTVRSFGEISEARALIAGAVQSRDCTLPELTAELAYMQGRGAALMRSVLAEVAAGIRSAPEGDLRDLIVRYGLPTPMFNPRLYLHGKFLAIPDAWWPEAGLVVEVDSREWHFSAESWHDTMRRHDRLTAAGILVLHVTPQQLRTEQARIVRDITAALRVGRPPAGITTRQASA